jgi:hypothetical protein
MGGRAGLRFSGGPGSPFVGAPQKSMMSNYEVPQADFLELKRHKLNFLNFGARGKIVYNIDTAATNFRMSFCAAGKFFTS